ncbi:MAG TPA: substrate-binding domain-containing protein [Burkholderiales bacterium]
MRERATIRLEPAVVWYATGARPLALDARLLQLLDAIKRHATLRAAAAATGLSYRAAWDLIGETARALGVSLVELRQGRGARLTAAGEQLLAANARALQRLRDDSLALELAPEPGPADARAALTLAASHDLLLAAFCDQWARREGIVREVAFRGSLESLKAFARGEADVAGFHSIGPPAQGATVRFRRLLDPRRDVLLRFAEREQGLIVPKGNPRRLTSLADVARQGALFVNRQRGSGTRALIDELLRQSGTAPSALRGYETEEYTHLAVAATVAAGQAEAGFGLRAAAVRLGLDFVPQRRESYWLAVRSRRLETEAVRRLRAGLAGEPLRAAARGLAGYFVADAGSIVTVPQALA